MLCEILVCITRTVHNIHAENRRLLMTLLTTLFGLPALRIYIVFPSRSQTASGFFIKACLKKMFHKLKFVETKKKIFDVSISQIK